MFSCILSGLVQSNMRFHMIEFSPRPSSHWYLEDWKWNFHVYFKYLNMKQGSGKGNIQEGQYEKISYCVGKYHVELKKQSWERNIHSNECLGFTLTIATRLMHEPWALDDILCGVLYFKFQCIYDLIILCTSLIILLK